MWVIAALVQERTGIEFRDFVRTRIAEPLRLPDLRMGCPPEHQHRVADVTHVGRAWTNEELIAKGFPPKPVTEVTEENLTRFNEPGVRAVGVPGGGVMAGAAEIALFYQALIAGGAGLWKAETIADARRIRNRAFLDPMFRQPANRGLGIVTAGGPEKAYFGFGRTASDATFGHGGAGGQIAWADPQTGLSFCFLTSGHDRDMLREGRRTTALSSLAGACALA
jgi:CubicO group peptidase (beta-lactamase class C family)